MKVAVWMLAAGALCAQPKFEVASVKAVSADEVRAAARAGASTFRVDGAQFHLAGVSLGTLIPMAYKLAGWQVTGPDWIFAERYEITAKIPEGVSKDQVPEMLQALLAERFNLVLKHEEKERSVYVLSVAPGGLKLKESPPETGQLEAPFGGNLGDRVAQVRKESPHGFMIARSMSTQRTTLDSPRLTMKELTGAVAGYVDAPIVDQTGVTMEFAITIDVPRSRLSGAAGRGRVGDAPPVNPEASDPDISIVPSLLKVGLKLEKRKIAMPMLTVEHAERVPVEN